VPLDAAIVDVGGGASRLAAELRRRGHTDVTVLDLSVQALEIARADLGEAAGGVTWVEGDVRSHDFGRRFDLWHDRAAFHFMVEPPDRDAYLATLDRTLRPGGHLILATFGPQGPTQCSGLPVYRYALRDAGRRLRTRLVAPRRAPHPSRPQAAVPLRPP
jgi:SAM-dependent methyltransferase